MTMYFNRRKGLVFLFTVMLLLVFSLTIVVQADASDSTMNPYIEVQVLPGDTLWNIVQSHYHGDKDIREMIYQVREENGLNSSNIYTGQLIKIPLN